MGSFNVTVNDSSPLISYAPAHAWVDTPSNDTSAASYQGSSLHTTIQPGATATFKFNGTGVWIYGAHRPGYGTYSVTVDGQSVSSGNASSLDATFNQLMGGSSGLKMGEHVVVLEHSGGGFIDFDTLIFETQLSQADHEVKTTIVDDNDSRISYTPSGKWPVARESYFSNSSVHWTFTEGAQASLDFTGDAIAVYGGSSYDHGDFEVTLDGKSQTYNGGDQSLELYHPMSLLYFASNLGSGNHKITVTLKSNTGYFDLDSFTVYEIGDAKSGSNSNANSGGMAGHLGDFHIHQVDANNVGSGTNTASSGGASSTAAAVSGATSSNKGGLAKSVIVGIIVASVLGFISLVLIIIFIITQVRRSRARKAAALRGKGDLESPVLPIQEPKIEVSAEGDADQKPKRITRFSMKSFRSRWSQVSFADPHPRYAEPAPPVPPMPSSFQTQSKVPQLAMPVPELKYKRDSVASTASGYSGKDDDIRSDLVDYYYGRQSTHSTETTSTVAPQRPARPPGLDLTPTLSKFDRVPL